MSAVATAAATPTRTPSPAPTAAPLPAQRRFVVRDWRTGAVVSSTEFPVDPASGYRISCPCSIALRPDGFAATTEGGVLYEVRPGAPPRLLTRRTDYAAYAGDSLVYGSSSRSHPLRLHAPATLGQAVRSQARELDELRVIEPSGRIRRFGTPTTSLGLKDPFGDISDRQVFATDGVRGVWVANGCLLVDDVSAPPAAAPGPGSCPRSELALDYQASPHLARTIPVVLRCVAAPRACHGTVRLTTAETTPAHAQPISRRVRFTIPAGHARRLQVPLTGRGYRLMLRRVARAKTNSEFARDAIVVLDARTDDGERFPGEGAERSQGELDLAARRVLMRGCCRAQR